MPSSYSAFGAITTRGCAYDNDNSDRQPQQQHSHTRVRKELSPTWQRTKRSDAAAVAPTCLGAGARPSCGPRDLVRPVTFSRKSNKRAMAQADPQSGRAIILATILGPTLPVMATPSIAHQTNMCRTGQSDSVLPATLTTASR